MKHFFTITIILLFTIGIQQSGQSQWIFGGGLKFNSNDEFKALAPHIKVGKDISEKFDINVDIGYYLSKKAELTLDLDLHYRLFNIADKVLINPTAGINFVKTVNFTNSLSLGASVRVLTDRYNYYVEPKYILNGEQWVFGVGVFF